MTLRLLEEPAHPRSSPPRRFVLRQTVRNCSTPNVRLARPEHWITSSAIFMRYNIASAWPTVCSLRRWARRRRPRAGLPRPRRECPRPATRFDDTTTTQPFDAANRHCLPLEKQFEETVAKDPRFAKLMALRQEQ